MKVTDVRITKIEKSNSRLKGIAVIIFNNVFTVRDIRIIEGDSGLFIAMPSIKLANGSFRDVCHPTSSEFLDSITKTVLEEYKNLNV